MKKCALSALSAAAALFLLLLPADGAMAADASFKGSEDLGYDIYYMGIKAGHARLAVRKGDGGTPETLTLVSEARSTKAFSLIYRVHDVIESTVDAHTLMPLKYEKNLDEGKYKNFTQVVFYRSEKTALTDGIKVSAIPEDAFDPLSALYHIRECDLKAGSSSFINVFADGENFSLQVKVLKEERVKVAAGTFDTIVVEPMMKFQGIFQHKGRLIVWLTRDSRRIPVKMKSEVVIGFVNAELNKIAGD